MQMEHMTHVTHLRRPLPLARHQLPPSLRTTLLLLLLHSSPHNDTTRLQAVLERIPSHLELQSSMPSVKRTGALDLADGEHRRHPRS